MDIHFEDQGYPRDTFLRMDILKDRAINEYIKWKRFIVAFDMDDTVVPNNGSCCDDVIELLQVCSSIPSMGMVVYTARNADENAKTIAQLKERKIRYDSINEDIWPNEHDPNAKIFYNVFLCDKAGLPAAYEILVAVVDWYFNQGGKEIIEGGKQ